MRRTLPAGQRVFAAGTPSLTQTPGPSASLCYVSLLPSPQKPWDAPGSVPQLLLPPNSGTFLLVLYCAGFPGQLRGDGPWCLPDLGAQDDR